MSKSYDNFISLSDAPEDIEKKVASMITDPARIKLNDKGHPDVCNVFSYYSIFTDSKVKDDVKDWCEGAKKGCTECKKILARILIDNLETIRQKRNKLSDADVEDIIKDGAKKARLAAAKTMDEVKKLINLAI